MSSVVGLTRALSWGFALCKLWYLTEGLWPKIHLFSCSTLPLGRPECKVSKIKHSLSTAMLLLILTLSVITQAQPLTRPFVTTLEELPDIAGANDYQESDSLFNDKPHRSATIIESISWRWLYVTHLLVPCELISATRDTPPRSSSYSWLPVEEVIAVCWLLKSHWNPDLLSFNPIEQKETTPMRLQGGHSFATITMMVGSGQEQQDQPSESLGQRTSRTITHPAGSLTAPLYSSFGRGNGNPRQHSHTLGLNCFVHPCRGVCQLRSSSCISEPDEWSLNSVESSCSHLANGYCFSCISPFNPLKIKQAAYATAAGEPFNLNNFLEESGISSKVACSETYQTSTASSQLGKSPIDLSLKGTIQVVSDHKREYHTEQPTCDVTIVGADGWQRPCRKVCRNVQALSTHKSAYHTGPKTCDVLVIGWNGQQRPCGRLCKSTKALSSHKTKYHTAQRICDVPMFIEDGRQRRCGKICKNSQALSHHKRSVHSGQRTCEITVVGQNCQQRRCGTVCKSAKALSDHKGKNHSGQRTCDFKIVGEDGRYQSCGTVCRNVNALSDHKRTVHSSQKTCYITVVGEDGQQRPCGKICKNLKALSDHKGRHRKSKNADLDQNDDLGP